MSNNADVKFTFQRFSESPTLFQKNTQTILLSRLPKRHSITFFSTDHITNPLTGWMRLCGHWRHRHGLLSTDHRTTRVVGAKVPIDRKVAAHSPYLRSSYIDWLCWYYAQGIRFHSGQINICWCWRPVHIFITYAMRRCSRSCSGETDMSPK
jgi:hypothetical protein